MSRFLLFSIINLIVPLLFTGSAHAQVDWSLSANFIDADAAGGPHLGLAHPIVRDIQEDGKGRMWFATQTGVSCLDGKMFKSYLHSPADSLLWKDWGCHFLTADGKGRIWLATTFKLFYFDETSDRFVEYDLTGIEPSAKKDNWQSEIYLQDLHDEGAVWFKKNTGLYAIDSRTLTIRKSLYLPTEYRSVCGILGKDRDGIVWSGGWKGKEAILVRPDGTIQQKVVLPFAPLWSIFEPKGSNRIWAGGEYLASFNKTNGRWEPWTTHISDLAGFAQAPKLTGDSILWMYPVGQTMVLGFNLISKKFDFQMPTVRMAGNFLRCGYLECLYVDHQNNVWLGGKLGVSVVFRDSAQMNKWILLDQKASDYNKTRTEPLIWGTKRMPDGSLAEWMCDEQFYTYVALSKHSKSFFEGWLNEAGNIEGQRIFINLENGSREVSQLIYKPNSNGQWVEIIGKTTTGAVADWPVSQKKVAVCRGSKFEADTDQSGTWVTSEGIVAYTFQENDLIAIISTDHFFKGQKIGYNHWSGLQIRTYGRCRTEMKVENKWVSRDSVILDWTCLDGNCDLEKGQKGAGFTKRYRAMQPGDSVFITEFRIFDEVIPVNPADFQHKEMIIEYDQNFILFDFSSSYDPAATTYWYKLEGFNHDWVQVRKQRTATYTNLDGGTYTFRVRATDAEGNELVNKATFRLRVRSPYYRTWWFYGLCLASVGGLFYTIFRYREIQRLRQEQLRLRIARDLHDEVGSTLSSISILSASALRGVEKDLDNARFGNIGDKARAALDSISDIVWSVNPENDSMDKALARMSTYASEMLENVGAELRFEVGEGVESLTLPMEKRKDFYLIFKEAIHNCAKYAQAKHVDVALWKEGNTLIMSVKDDGVGFEMQDMGQKERNLGGNGLRNMESRAAAIGGDLRVTSSAGAGTEVYLTLPLSI